MTPARNTRARLFTRTKMAEFYQEILKWLDTMSGLMKALPVTQTNSEAMARMYMTMFTMLQSFVERLPISGAAAVAAVPAKAPTALPALPTAPLSIRRPIEIVREAAAMPLPDEPQPAAARAAAEMAPAGAEEESEDSDKERPITNKISLRAHGYRMNAKDATRFAALEKARAAHGTGTVLHRLELLQKIWKTCDHSRAAEFRQNILADIAYLREIDRRAASHGDE